MPRPIVRCRPDPVMIAGFDRIRSELNIPTVFPDAVLQAATDAVVAGPQIPPGAASTVIDARDIPFIAIDPPGSTDLDQAFFARRHRDGYTVLYAIADVASLVAPGSPVDLEARDRGLTLYSPDLRTSLHPESINEDGGSLLEGRQRRALLWTIEVDGEGVLGDARLERADVRTRHQLSYQAAQAEMDIAGPDAALSLLREIGELRQAQERHRGAVSLALPSQEVMYQADGSFTVLFDQSLPIEGWNAQISLLTGIAASRIMLDAGVGILRTLPEPDDRTLGQLRRTASALGVEWPRQQSYADRVRSLRPNTPETAAMLSQAARGLRGAGYVAFTDHNPPSDPRHSAIASTYSHVTAPLRRLCDRFANEVVLAQCAGQAPPAWATEALGELPSLMGSAKNRDRNLERAMVDFMEAIVLTPLIGKTFAAVVTNVDNDREQIRIQLREPAVVVKINTSSVGREPIELGSEIAVRLVATDPGERRVNFVVV
ncbi:MAG: RNB domain-containing ribonuclease [Acidimicrobiales bacterium]|nr:RNB domain-containing ribonuclease [Acidimicrobiales bacterium]MDG2217950.1 RNB domain-containing ribonuclease [Acidimicrobiales bacterium]